MDYQELIEKIDGQVYLIVECGQDRDEVVENIQDIINGADVSEGEGQDAWDYALSELPEDAWYDTLERFNN